MFDLPMRADAQAVPVPLAGRVIVFAGADGVLMAKHSDGSVSAFRGADGADGANGANGADGARGLGLKLRRSVAPLAVAPAFGAQALAVCPFGAGELAAGDVLTVDAQLSVEGVGAANYGQSRATFRARADGGAWVVLFSSIYAARDGGVSLRVRVLDGELWAVASAVVWGTGVGDGYSVRTAAKLPANLAAGFALELQVEWTGKAPSTVKTWPITVEVIA